MPFLDQYVGDDNQPTSLYCLNPPLLSMSNANLPTGTVTFLFTDIQGSTQLWQQFPNAMPEALKRHHEILRRAIEEHRGYVFQIIGDAFCAAFHTAPDGLNAALAAQRGLRDAAWGETGPIRVRMALHSGAVELRLGEYTSGEYVSGLTLSRAARLLSAGHGGQVLLSLPASELVQERLPEGVELRDLGAQRLKDLVRPEHIFQTITPDLPAEFPPLKTLDARPHNLPAQLTSFIGRQGEMAEIKGTLLRAAPVTRLLTLSGPGGTGKTRLALQIAANLIDEFPDGAWFVDLAPLSDPERVPGAVAAALGLREVPWRPLGELLADYLRLKKLLLVLDNCEHLVEACARIAQALLQAGAEVKILATSREPLAIPGEVVYRVPTLSLPDPQAPPAAEAISQSEAVRLFAERAAAARPDFAVTDAIAPAIVQICTRLDGIPLAIELAAARLRALSVEQIADRIEDRFRLLTSGSRTSLPRQQTLRALIDWSYNLLTEEERKLFQRLAVFSGGWTLEAAEATCSGEGIGEFDLLDLLAHLVDRSLVVVEEPEGLPRYRLLETIRQYAAEVLDESDRSAYWRSRHLDTYLTLAEEAGLVLRSSQDILWMERLEKEHDNLRAALETAWQGGETQAVLRLGAALYYFWYRRGHIQEGMQHLQQAASLPEAQQHPLELARLLEGLGLYYWLNGEYVSTLKTLDQALILAKSMGAPARVTQALVLYYRSVADMRLGNFTAAQQEAEAALALPEEIQYTYGLAVSNYGLGRIWLEQGQIQAARPHLEQALIWSRTAGDRLVISLVLNSLELVAISDGDYSGALALNQESLELAWQMKDMWMVSGALREAGNVSQAIGDYPAASDYFTESGEISRQQGLLNDYARTRFNLGYVAVLQGRLPAARSKLHESLELFSRFDNRRGRAEALDGFAALAAAEGNHARAARLLGAADASFETLGAGRWPVDLLEYQKLRAALEGRLGIDAFHTHYASGRQLSLEQALEAAAEA